MLKKLRRRFVSLTMLLVSAVLILFYIFTAVIIYFIVTNEVQSSLRNYTSESYLFQSFELGSDHGQDPGNYMFDSSSVCIVSVSNAGVVTYLDSGHAYMEKSILNSVVSSVLRSNAEFGRIQRYNLFYYKAATTFGYRIAFADASNYMSYLKFMLIYDSFTFLIVLVILYVITSRLASIFIKPVDRAWTQQQNFIADASHELKTPLTVILANTNILQAHRSNTVEEQIKWIDSTSEEAVHMKGLVDKMLMLAKAENQKQASFFTEVDISDLVTRLALQFDPVAYENGVTLHTAIENGLYITADSTAVNQIIHILIDNAVKYAGMGGEVRLTLERKQKNIYLITKNTGAPIPPEDLPHIFERFYRSDKSRAVGGGYGLGLAICRSLVEQQNAEIYVRSSAEEGTVFTVKFKKSKK